MTRFERLKSVSPSDKRNQLMALLTLVLFLVLVLVLVIGRMDRQASERKGDIPSPVAPLKSERR